MAKKIEEFMLSKDLQDKINQVSNLTQVHMDQLDASLKTLLTNIGNASQGVISYDDSEIRNRVISLEKLCYENWMVQQNFRQVNERNA